MEKEECGMVCSGQFTIGFLAKKFPETASSQLGSCSFVIGSSETGLGGLQPVDIFGPAMQVNVIQGNKLQGSVV